MPAIERWKNDPDTTRWMGRRFREPSPAGLTENRVRALLDHPPADGCFFVIADPTTLSYRGAIDLTDLDTVDRNAVLSIVIADPADRGRGWGGEAVGLVLSHAFGTLGLHKVSLNVSSENTAALRCYQRLGFRSEGRIRDHSWVGGRFEDRIPMGILEAEYRSRC